MKSKRIQPTDHQQAHNIEFSKAELKTLFNSLLIDVMSDEDVSERKEQLLKKLNYFITD